MTCRKAAESIVSWFGKRADSDVTGAIGARGRSSGMCSLATIFLWRSARGLNVKCYAMQQLMPNQVGKKNSKSLLQWATFGSLSQAYSLLCSLVVKYF